MNVAAGEFKPVTGDDLPAELHAVYACEEEDFVPELVLFRISERQEASGLSERLDNENAGHDRYAGEMPLEEWFVEADVFVSHDVIARHAFNNTVHQ